MSNGHGEDAIAFNIIKAFRKRISDADVTVFPLVGQGLAYKDMTVSYQNPIFPSGGFLRSFKDIFNDIKAGLISNTLKQQKALRKLNKSTDLTLCVGDIFCLLMGKLGNTNPIVFLPTAKSDFFMPHTWIERWLMKVCADLIFTRDEETALSLQNAQLPAFFLGNPMMDDLSVTVPSSKEKIVVLLPGSREEAYLNLYHLLEICCSLHHTDRSLQFVWVKSDSLDSYKFNKEGWSIEEKSGFSFLTNGKIKIFITHLFKESIAHASVVLGLAGTANEQAIYMGKTVFCFEGFGPQSTSKRFKEQKLLLGERLQFLEDKNPDIVAKTVLHYLQEKNEQNIRFQDQGFISSVNQDSASDLIVEKIIENLTHYWGV